MISFLAPIFAVIFGVLIVLLHGKSKLLNLRLFLAFSGAFLLSTTIFELLPEVYSHLDPKQIGVFIMGGILLQIILEFYSKGAEHGHLDTNEPKNIFPWLLFMSLGIHAFFEGFPLREHKNLILGVVIHKIPIAILIATYLLKSKLDKSKVIVFILVFTIMTPLGSLIGGSLNISSKIIQSVNAIVIGMFFHISTIILFESREDHNFNINKILIVISAVVLAYII
jgi:zinc transporter ZupT